MLQIHYVVFKNKSCFIVSNSVDSFFLRRNTLIVGLSNDNAKLPIRFPTPILKIGLVEGEENSSSISTCSISF